MHLCASTCMLCAGCAWWTHLWVVHSFLPKQLPIYYPSCKGPIPAVFVPCLGNPHPASACSQIKPALWLTDYCSTRGGARSFKRASTWLACYMIYVGQYWTLSSSAYQCKCQHTTESCRVIFTWHGTWCYNVLAHEWSHVHKHTLDHLHRTQVKFIEHSRQCKHERDDCSHTCIICSFAKHKCKS